MSRWYPIQDAPTDGTLLLLTDGDEVLSGYWNDNDAFGFGWIICDPSNLYIGTAEPTHWMPMPEPPRVET